ncbi:MAG: hypothetical protein QXZ02_07385 [Candidatus Bathyarchaeia archaeon]
MVALGNRMFYSIRLEDKEDDRICFKELKNLVRKHLPSHSPLRKAILSEPDYLPKEKAISKIEVYLTLLYSELGFE